MSFEPIHPLTGPVFVKGAEPGDALEISVVDLKHKGWGWNAVLPGFGLLADDFTSPYLHHYALTRRGCIFRKDIVIPYEPFCGVMGVALREPGRLNTIPPRENGGNIDIRHLTPGATLYLPVLVTGRALLMWRLSCGAGRRRSQRHGHRIAHVRDASLQADQARAPAGAALPHTARRGPLTAAGASGYFVTTAHGPDLFTNAQTAIRYMIDHVAKQYKMSREQAYCLCGAAVDLKISEIVDAPNWIVSAYLPLAIFR